MGLSNKRQGSLVWLSIKDGKFRMKRQDGTYEEFNTLEGHIIGISFRDGSYENEKWREITVKVADGPEVYCFGAKMSNSYGRGVAYKLPNCNFSSPVCFQPSMKTDKEGKKNHSMYVSQGGVNVKQKWTRDEPGDLPQAEKHEIKGKVIYDDTAQIEWLEKYYAENVCNRLAPPPKFDEEHETSSESQEEEEEEEGDFSSDIPF